MGRKREPLTRLRKRQSGCASRMITPVFKEPEEAKKPSKKKGGGFNQENVQNSMRCEPPDWLNEKARVQWDEILPRITHIVNRIDRNVLGRYCSLMALWVDMHDQLVDTPINTGLESEDKVFVKRQVQPEFKMIEALQKQLHTIEQLFGMNPSARATLRLYIPQDQEMDARRKNKKPEIKDFMRSANG